MPESYDSNQVLFYKEGTELAVGHAYQGKDDLKIHIKRCPECDTENYALAISDGNCYSCGFNPNKSDNII